MTSEMMLRLQAAKTKTPRIESSVGRRSHSFRTPVSCGAIEAVEAAGLPMDGWVLSGDSIEFDSTISEANLAAIVSVIESDNPVVSEQRSAKDALAQAAERARQRVIGNAGPVKMSVYMLKASEAEKIILAGAAVSVSGTLDVPLANARAQSTGMALMDVATEWNAKAVAWRTAAAAIEEMYDQGVRDINAATTVDLVNAAVATAVGVLEKV